MVENGGRERGGTPIQGLKPPRPALDDYSSEVYMENDKGNSPTHHVYSHRKKRVSSSFSEFTSTFDMPPPSFTSKPNFGLLPSKVAHYPHHTSVKFLTETGSVASTSFGPRTPMRVLKPPSLREAVESQNRPLEGNLSSPSGRGYRLHTVISAGTDKLKLSSVMSHLTSLEDPISHLASPKCMATELNRKLVPIAPPTLAPEPPKGLNEAVTATPSSVSHAERAKTLASAVRISRTHQPAKVDFAELSRGLELSPQKHERAPGKKLIKLVPDLSTPPDLHNDIISFLRFIEVVLPNVPNNYFSGPAQTFHCGKLDLLSSSKELNTSRRISVYAFHPFFSTPSVLLHPFRIGTLALPLQSVRKFFMVPQETKAYLKKGLSSFYSRITPVSVQR